MKKQIYCILNEGWTKIEEAVSVFNDKYHGKCHLSKHSMKDNESTVLISEFEIGTETCIKAIISSFKKYGDIKFYDEAMDFIDTIRIYSKVNQEDDISENDDDPEEDLDFEMDEGAFEEEDIEEETNKFDIQETVDIINQTEGLADPAKLTILAMNLKQLRENENYYIKRICINTKNRDAFGLMKAWTKALYYSGFGRGTEISTMKDLYSSPEPSIGRSAVGAFVILDTKERKDDYEKRNESIIRDAVLKTEKDSYTVFFVVEDKQSVSQIEKICGKKLMYVEFNLDEERERQKLVAWVLNEKNVSVEQETFKALCRVCDDNIENIKNAIDFGQINAISRAQGKGSVKILPVDLENEKLSKNDDSSSNNRALDKINEMIGQNQVKTAIIQIGCELQVGKMKKEAGLPVYPKSMHMLFTGNPGTGKTTIARYIGEYFKELGLLSRGRFYEISRANLIGQYTGWTIKNTKECFRDAAGSVLFVDEAPTLVTYENDSYGLEALNQICLEMENRRDDIVVIFAGYKDKMEEMFKRNNGLRERFAYRVYFEDYSTDELMLILDYQLKQYAMEINEESKVNIREFVEKARYNDNGEFGNGRFIRRIVERIGIHQAERIVRTGNKDLVMISSEDVVQTLGDPDMQIDKKCEVQRIGF